MQNLMAHIGADESTLRLGHHRNSRIAFLSAEWNPPVSIEIEVTRRDVRGSECESPLDHEYRSKVTVMESRESLQSNKLRTGCAVPSSGVYRVTHKPHQLPAEVTLLQDQIFPRCSRCGEVVYFTLERANPAVATPHDFNVALYELPELVDEEEGLAS